MRPTPGEPSEPGTGPVERAPLTDERLRRLIDRVHVRARQGLPAPEAADDLIAELRASRGREQELQQRIDEAMVVLHRYNPRPDLNGDQFAELRATLTGTETADD
jgi:hypothetical protein